MVEDYFVSKQTKYFKDFHHINQYCRSWWKHFELVSQGTTNEIGQAKSVVSKQIPHQ